MLAPEARQFFPLAWKMFTLALYNYQMKYLFLLLISAAFLFSCSEKKDSNQQTAMDVGRTFIRASLDGNFDAAAPLLLDDAQNKQAFESFRAYFTNLPEAERNQYKTANYDINKYEDINDSTAIINYSNSYMKKPMEIKLVRVTNKWLVDFKYTFSGNLPIN
jgi:hypothetical protein